jgi:hypothetical protein
MKSGDQLTVYGLKGKVVIRRGDSLASLTIVEAMMLAEELRSASKLVALLEA